MRVDELEDYTPEAEEVQNTPTDSAPGLDMDRHKWLDCMDEFAEFIQNVSVSRLSNEPIMVALVDDVIDIYEPSLNDKVVGGGSFAPRKAFPNENKPYYVTNGGHGTAMASLICRVCPKARLYILRLEEYKSDQLKRQVTASNAAKVCLTR